MRWNFNQLFIDCIAKYVQNDNITSSVEFLSSLILEIFNFIRYANHTTYDITVHNFLKIVSNL